MGKPQLDKKMEKKFEKWVKAQEKKPTARELVEIKKLEKQALSLWKKRVRYMAEGICEAPGCKKTKRLNCHHIESYSTNKGLRYDPRNGALLCTTDHKFGRHSAHRSFCFMYEFMIWNRPDDLEYLLAHYKDKIEITKQYLEEVILRLS